MPSSHEAQKKQKQKDRDQRKQWERLTKNNITEIKPVADQAIRDKTAGSLIYFLQEFFTELFSDPFGSVQLDSIAHEERVIREGGRPIMKLEPRGYGKSTRSLLAAVWAILNGYRRFVLICCDSVEKSQDLL